MSDTTQHGRSLRGHTDTSLLGILMSRKIPTPPPPPYTDTDLTAAYLAGLYRGQDMTTDAMQAEIANLKQRLSGVLDTLNRVLRNLTNKGQPDPLKSKL